MSETGVGVVMFNGDAEAVSMGTVVGGDDRRFPVGESMCAGGGAAVCAGGVVSIATEEPRDVTLTVLSGSTV